MKTHILSNTLKAILLCFLSAISFSISAQTTVNSLAALLPYLDDNNANVKLVAGTYNVTAVDVKAGKYPLTTVFKDGVILKAILLFSGNNSTYDFTGVTINVETAVFQAYGNFEVYEAHVTGNYNVVKNLSLVDVGSVNDFPTGGAVNLVMDGSYNRYEGINVRSTGSKPYGYGDAFGKGGTNNIIGHKKHSTFLVRGDHNHALNCTLIHRTYGHCIFMQAASYPTIEGCYVEGEMRSTDDMLAEAGTGSAADKVGFMTTWGYKLPAGYMMALGEEGIRAYNGGTTIINGEISEGEANNVSVLNCTVKNMRGGITLAHASGTKYVEGCTVIGCEQGYAIGTGDIVNCKADAAYGPVYKSTYANDNALKVDITILPASHYYNGTNCLAYLGGKNHTINLRSADANINPDLKILMGGYTNDIRMLNGSNASQNNHTATGIKLNNYTMYPITLPTVATNNTIVSCGLVTNNGSGNTITKTTACALVNSCNNTVAKLEAECYDNMLGITSEACSEGGQNIGNIHNGDWTVYNNMDLTGMNSIQLRAASKNTAGGSVEVRLGSITGTLIASVPVTNTGDWQTYVTKEVNIKRVTGAQNIYLVFKGGAGGLMNINWFGFSDKVFCANTPALIEAECYTSMLGIQTENCSEGTLNVGYINNGDWLAFNGLNLTGMKSIKARVSGKTSGSTIEVRTGSITGNLIATIPVSNTGGNQTWVTDSVNLSAVTGTQNVLLVFKGAGTGYLFNINSFSFSDKVNIVTGFENTETSDFEIYPNPSTGVFSLNSSEFYKVIDALGNVVLSGEGTQIDLSSKNQGVYILQIGTESFKIIKQ